MGHGFSCSQLVNPLGSEWSMDKILFWDKNSMLTRHDFKNIFFFQQCCAKQQCYQGTWHSSLYNHGYYRREDIFSRTFREENRISRNSRTFKARANHVQRNIEAASEKLFCQWSPWSPGRNLLRNSRISTGASQCAYACRGVGGGVQSHGWHNGSCVGDFIYELHPAWTTWRPNYSKY